MGVRYQITRRKINSRQPNARYYRDKGDHLYLTALFTEKKGRKRDRKYWGSSPNDLMELLGGDVNLGTFNKFLDAYRYIDKIQGEVADGDVYGIKHAEGGQED